MSNLIGIALAVAAGYLLARWLERWYVRRKELRRLREMQSRIIPWAQDTDLRPSENPFIGETLGEAPLPTAWERLNEATRVQGSSDKWRPRGKDTDASERKDTGDGT